MNNRPLIGLGVIVIKDNKVLMGKRRNAHGEGHWSFPGGHLEYQEAPEDGALREVKEETGLTVVNIVPGPYTNDVFSQDDKHYITLFMIAHHQEGEPKVMEPEKCERWEWQDWQRMPQPLFLPIVNLHRQGYSPFVTKE
ncbi:MAG: NUDIX hydrolase [bacterium]